MNQADGRLCERLHDVCTSVAPRLPGGALRDAVEASLRRLADPKLRIAVGGRLNAGKSTLVNALLGTRLAPTDATECTLLAAWFRYHHRSQVTVHFTDGSTGYVAARPGGGVPAALPFDHHSVTHLTVQAPVAGIDDEYVLIDTPGRDALSGLDDYSMAAIREADGLIFVMHDPGEVELRALEEFRGAIAGSRLSAGNVLGVLSRIDTIADHLAPRLRRAEAAAIAARTAARLRGLVSTIVPVANRLAQAARCAAVTEAHAAAVVELAAADPAGRRRLFFDDDMFLDASVSVARPVRADLLSLLGRYGVEEAVAAVDGGARGATALRAALLAVSGLPELRTLITERFVRNADALRADGVLALLERALAAGPPPSGGAQRELADAVHRLRREPALRAAQLAEVATAYAAGDLPLDDAMALDLHHLLTGVTVAQRLGMPDADAEALRAEADRRITRWQTAESELPRRSKRLARTVIEVLNQLWFGLEQSR